VKLRGGLPPAPESSGQSGQSHNLRAVICSNSREVVPTYLQHTLFLVEAQSSMYRCMYTTKNAANANENLPPGYECFTVVWTVTHILTSARHMFQKYHSATC
jgi:hypothetical protein